MLKSVPHKRRRTARRKNVRPPGRPPAGAQVGEKVRDYPQISIRVPLDVKLTLQSLATLKSLPQWRIIRDAIVDYTRGLSTDERHLLDAFVKQAKNA